MKNVLRFVVFVVLCYASFALSHAIYAFFDTILSVYKIGRAHV